MRPIRRRMKPRGGKVPFTTPFKAYLLDRRLTNRQVAEILGYSEGQTSRLVNGRRYPSSMNQAEAIARRMHTTIGTLWPNHVELWQGRSDEGKRKADSSRQAQGSSG